MNNKIENSEQREKKTTLREEGKGMNSPNFDWPAVLALRSAGLDGWEGAWEEAKGTKEKKI